MSPKLSISSVGTFKRCAKAYWFGHIQKVPSKTDYPRLLGIAVHRFIARMYAPGSHPLYYTDLTSARRAWFWNWNNTLKENRLRIKFPNKKKEKENTGIGWSCIEKYWNKNINKPRPIELEKSYEMVIHGTYRLVGAIDQVRRISLEGIAKIRPELISEGQLIEGYAPVVIVDLKTGRGSWDLTDYAPKASQLEIAAHQFELHDDLQATAYWELYHKTHRKMPVGFYSYQLQSGKAFLTIRTENDYPTLLETLNSVISGIEEEKFPMNVGSHCEYCDFFEACVAVRKDRPLYVSKSSDGVGGEGERNEEIQSKNIKVRRARQLRLKLKMPKTAKAKPVVSQEGIPESQAETTGSQIDLQTKRLEKFLADGEGENPVIITLPSLDYEEGKSDDQLST
jgi:CRISPR/Cas system-associated exonuclease Cas4 (RecB family)